MPRDSSTRSSIRPASPRTSNPHKTVRARTVASARDLGAPRHNLPLPLSSFIGREEEIARLAQLMATERLVTITGPGGCGKTRLALEVARSRIEHFPDGVYWVELAAVNDPLHVPQIIASILGVREPMNQPIHVLVDYLREKKVLLILDNCEHLLDACAQVAYQLARQCATLSILATGREALNIEGERVWLLPSMTIPPPEQWSDSTALTEFEGIRLFIERAQAVAPRFTLTPQNALAMAEVCYQLDGIPLAIELAAARVKVLSPEQISSRLDDRFNLLVGGSRMRLPRHQTLRAAIDWSYDLLSEAERILLQRVAVFVGGWSLEAAEAVCAESPREAQRVLDGLAQLVEKSLIVMQEQRGVVRYDMLETIRHYALEKLTESDRVETIRNRHLAFFLQLIEQGELYETGPNQVDWFGRVEREHNNLRSALQWSLESAQPESALRLAASLTWFWFTHGYWNEGRQWLKQALDQSGDAAVLTRAGALNSAGYFAVLQSDYQEAMTLSNESLAIYREKGDKRGMSLSLFHLSLASSDQNDHLRAQAFAQESLALRRETQDKHGIAFSLHLLGDIARGQGDYPRALSLHEESLALWREIENTWAIPYSLTCMSWVARLQGRYREARDLLQESLALWQELGDARGAAANLWQLGAIERGLGNAVLARSHLQRAVTIFVRVGDRWSLAFCFEDLAEIARAEGELERAARLFGAAEALRQAIAVPLSPVESAQLERSRQATAAALGKQAFLSAVTKGRELRLDQVVTYALEFTATPPGTGQSSQPATPRRTSKAKFDGLTAREREVAVLISQGKSNRAIAAQLVVTERTIEKHVENILSKLGFTSRTQIVAWAVQKGLSGHSD